MRVMSRPLQYTSPPTLILTLTLTQTLTLGNMGDQYTAIFPHEHLRYDHQTNWNGMKWSRLFDC